MTHLRNVELVGTSRRSRRNRSTPSLALVESEQNAQPRASFAPHSYLAKNMWGQTIEINAVAMGVMLRYLAARHDHMLADRALAAGGSATRAVP